MALLVVLVLLVGGSSAFNLEARIPVIKEGMKGSYFGYSVAQHQARDNPSAPWNNW